MIAGLFLKTLYLSIIEASVNQYVRTDNSAPELEIDLREYTNPCSLKDNITQKSIVTNDDPTLRNAQDDNITEDLNEIELAELENNNLEHNNEITRPKSEESGDSDYIETMWQETKMIGFDTKEENDVVSVATNDIPKMPRRMIGPQREPYKEPKFNGVGPKGMDVEDTTTCNEFSRTARFNPYSVLDDQWFCFYRYAPDNTALIIEFIAPTSWEIANIRKFLDKQLIPRDAVNWTARMVIMVDLIYNHTCLLVERSPNGMFWLYPIRPNYTETLAPEDVRLKQTADNKYFALVLCDDHRAFIFSRRKEIPRKRNIQEAVATIGWRSRDGKSYLYQGHKWGPVPELDEAEYWAPGKYARREQLPPDPEPYDPKTDPVKIFGKDHNLNFGKSGGR